MIMSQYFGDIKSNIWQLKFGIIDKVFHIYQIIFKIILEEK